jgi:homoserine O-acetyltransferase
VIDAPYGHDCFLLEETRQTPIIKRFLQESRRSAAKPSEGGPH